MSPYRAVSPLVTASRLLGWDEAFRPKPVVLLCLLIVIIGADIVQDYWHAASHQYPFYFSESILFKVKWVLFVLMAGVQLYVLNRQHHALGPEWAAVATLVVAGLLSALHSVLFAHAVHLLSALFFGHTYPVGRLLRYSVSDGLSTYALIFLPAGLVYRPRVAPPVDAPRVQESPAPLREALQTIVVGSGRHTAVVRVDTILFISAANPYVTIHTLDKKHLYSASLKSIHEQLDPAQFVRIHKSTIINLVHIASYASRLNGDYDVLLKSGQVVRLSRSYATVFKQHVARLSPLGPAKSSG